MHKKLYQEIKKDDDLNLINDQIDLFFHGNVLKRYLPFPIWKERDTLVRLYTNFWNRLEQDCVYKVANIQRCGKSFLANILFSMSYHQKFMLSFLYAHGKDIDEQRNLIYEALNGYHQVTLSDVSLLNEILPDTIQDLIRDLTSRHVDVDKLKLRKITGKNREEKTISFHELHCLMDREKRSGISIIAGFQY